MKIIGEKLNESEMLSIKGGSSCNVCTCSSGDAGPFYTLTESQAEARAEFADDCGQNSTVSCIWKPDDNCPGVM